ncbi:MAG: QueT transporter family protein [Lysinibacillus sp.]
MKVKFLAINGIVAALYVAISLTVAPFGFTEIQFRISEIFNHLIAFNPLFAGGIILGVFITNLFSPLGIYDLFFGVGHSVLTIGLLLFFYKFVKNIWARLALNTFIFSFTMCIIAYEINLVSSFEDQIPFMWLWFTVAAGEFIVLAVGAPIMYAMNKRMHFKNLY